MAPKRWEQINEIFHTALTKEPEQRGEYLDEACADDSETRREVERLLTLHEHTADFLEKPAIEVAARALVEHESLDRIGPYRILRTLGEGGMGIVYLAEQEEPIRRKVALKVIKLGMDTKEVIARFDSERQALALMNHPNIATIYDAGKTERGQPYFVMEYVPGVPIHEYCDRNRLSTKERLELFTQVCGAIEHAHQKGVIHRDLKPSNVLVVAKDGKAVPKVIDFGLAKATSLRLTEKTYFTQHGALIGTPAYMSPEQAEMTGLEVEKTTDIYSLGVVLYQLLVGVLPFDVRVLRQAGYDEMRRVIRETDPPIPSDKLRSLGASAAEVARYHSADLTSLARELKGDLDWITAKAMEKAPTRRYPSAAEFALDISHHLKDEPIVACPVGLSDRLRRSVRKRKDLVRTLAIACAASLVVVTIFAFLYQRFVRPGRMELLPAYQVTGWGNWEGQPELSPDGGRIVYSADISGTRNIFVTDIRGIDRTQLTSDPAWDMDPTWFPDGSAIAFCSERGGSKGIWRVGLSGGGATLMLEHSSDPAISPDQSRIAYAQATISGSSRIEVASLAMLTSSHILTDVEDKAVDASSPAWSPDSRTICYVDRRELWLVDAAGGPPRQLTYDGEEKVNPVWSPDGRRIYFASYEGGSPSLWRIGVTGGTAERLTQGTGPENHPSISRDGRYLVHTTDKWDLELVIRDRESEKETLLPGLGWHMPSIAPDGSKIVSLLARSGFDKNLYLQPLKNGIPIGAPERLTEFEGVASHPTFSPEGKWIACYHILKNKRDIWLASVPEGRLRRFTRDSARNMQPSWSPDGSQIAYTSERSGCSQIWIAPVKDGGPAGKGRQLTTGECFAYAPTWSTDGKRVAFTLLSMGRRDAWVMPADGSAPAERLTQGADVRQIRWDRRTDNLLASGSWGKNSVTLTWIFPETAYSEPFSPDVDLGGNRSGGYFDISSDGRWLVYVRESRAGHIWLTRSTDSRFE